MLAARADRVHIVKLLFAQHFIPQQFTKPHNGVHRRAQLMTHIGHKLALGLVGRFGPVLGLFKLGLCEPAMNDLDLLICVCFSQMVLDLSNIKIEKDARQKPARNSHSPKEHRCLGNSSGQGADIHKDNHLPDMRSARIRKPKTAGNVFFIPPFEEGSFGTVCFAEAVFLNIINTLLRKVIEGIANNNRPFQKVPVRSPARHIKALLPVGTIKKFFVDQDG